MTNDQRWEFYVAGVKFHEAHLVLSELEEGTVLEMESEPTNKYDSSAVKLTFPLMERVDDETKDIMIGYVPAKISSQVTAFLIVNDKPSCKITELNVSEKPWKQIRVVIEEGKDESNSL